MPAILRGIPATNGIAIGSYVLYDPTPPAISKAIISPEAVPAEEERLQQAIQASVEEVKVLREQVQAKLGAEEAAIFDAHLLMFEDEALLDSANQHIEGDLMNAEWALWEAAEEFARILSQLEDAYFQGRAADIQDIRARIINHLQGRPTAQLRYMTRPAIVVARDLLPSDTAGLDAALVLGLVTEQGGPTSHTAILSRQMGIPAVVGATGLLDAAQKLDEASSQLVLNGSTGEVVLNPDLETIQRYEAALEAYQQKQQQLRSLSSMPATTLDGVTLELAANIGRSHDAPPALEGGANGVGLFRTEFLFFDRESAPSEEEQLAAYSSVLQAFAGKNVIVRTLDIGGDKSIPYLELPKENNPFLGLRGIRLCLAKEYQSLFRTQVRALLLAAQDSPASLWIMFPMICDLRELRQAKAFIHETEEMLLQEGKLSAPVMAKLQIGIMLETPASVWLIDQLAQEADFFSIGTNDLAQYTLASDRMNGSLAELHRPFHPAVMRSLAHIILSARKQQRWVGMCGEMAGDPRATAFLLGLGINELSMEAKSLNAVKHVIRTTTVAHAQQLVEHVLAAESSLAIEELLTSSRAM
ncbi:MAG: phosphoenolpyruvate--protein phosphotransferase [Ktedonobacteraceae bacterium]